MSRDVSSRHHGTSWMLAGHVPPTFYATELRVATSRGELGAHDQEEAKGGTLITGVFQSSIQLSSWCCDETSRRSTWTTRASELPEGAAATVRYPRRVYCRNRSCNMRYVTREALERAASPNPSALKSGRQSLRSQYTGDRGPRQSPGFPEPWRLWCPGSSASGTRCSSKIVFSV